MAFVLIALVGMYPGRRIGWMMSRAFLYSAPIVVVVVACVLWGVLTAYLIHLLIIWQHPHWILKWIFGFALGAYVSVPNFGLLIESSVPDHAMPRHFVVSHLSYLIYIICSVVFAYFL
jgi:hypothetical protein